MILGVMSDSHDHLDNIAKAVQEFTDRKIAALIHGGDLCSPFVFRQLEKLRTFCPRMYAVFGNNDGDRVLLSEKGKGFCTFRDGALILELGGGVSRSCTTPMWRRACTEAGISIW